MKVALGMGRLSLKRLTAEGLEEGFFTGDPGNMLRLRIRASLFTEVLLRPRRTWNQEGGSYTGDLE
jgi:hypothetical protein